jgi:hypothetical protein
MKWLAEASKKTNVAPRRINRAVANAIVISALQGAIDEQGLCQFLIKGGAHLELRLSLRARASRDLDMLFRGAFDEMLQELDRSLARGWGTFELVRSEPEDIKVPGRVVQPKRIIIKIRLQGTGVLSTQLEVSPDEGGAGERAEFVRLPSLEFFGITTPEQAAALAVDFQVAQKLHACTDPSTDEQPNERIHDIVDLLMLREVFFGAGQSLTALRQSCVQIFDARAELARQAGKPPRPWPPIVEDHEHWREPYARLAGDSDVGLAFNQAIETMNAWINEIDAAK